MDVLIALIALMRRRIPFERRSMDAVGMTSQRALHQVGTDNLMIRVARSRRTGKPSPTSLVTGTMV